MVDTSQRAERILDAAAELILRWGYKRVSIEEIAKRAGVGKGTIYLHFATREALFVRVLMRESLGLVDELIEAMRRDPAAVLPGEQARLTYREMLRRPLLHAMFSRDIEVLGELARESAGGPLQVLKAELAEELLRLLRAHRLIRDDVELDVQRYTLNAVQTGFYLSAPLTVAPIAAEVAAAALADTIRAAVHTPRCADPEALAAVAPAVIAMYERFRAGMAAAVTAPPRAADSTPERGRRRATAPARR